MRRGYSSGGPLPPSEDAEGYSSADDPTSNVPRDRTAAALTAVFFSLMFGVPLCIFWYQIVLDLWEWKGFIK